MLHPWRLVWPRLRSHVLDVPSTLPVWDEIIQRRNKKAQSPAGSPPPQREKSYQMALFRIWKIHCEVSCPSANKIFRRVQPPLVTTD